MRLLTIPLPQTSWYLLAKCSMRECVSACGNLGEEAGLEESSKDSEDQRLGSLFPHHHPPCPLPPNEGDGQELMATGHRDWIYRVYFSGQIPGHTQVELPWNSPLAHMGLGPFTSPGTARLPIARTHPLVLTSHCSQTPALIAQADNLAEGVC